MAANIVEMLWKLNNTGTVTLADALTVVIMSGAVILFVFALVLIFEGALKVVRAIVAYSHEEIHVTPAPDELDEPSIRTPQSGGARLFPLSSRH